MNKATYRKKEFIMGLISEGEPTAITAGNMVTGVGLEQ